MPRFLFSISTGLARALLLTFVLAQGGAPVLAAPPVPGEPTSEGLNLTPDPVTADPREGIGQVSSMIELGGGVESRFGGEPINIYLEVQVGVSWLLETSDPEEDSARTTRQIYIARTHADFGVSTSLDSLDVSERLPFFDIDFMGYEYEERVEDLLANKDYLASFRLGRAALSRDIRTDDGLIVRVTAIGASYGGQIRPIPEVGLFAQVVADVLGYKLVSALSVSDPFHGLAIGSLGGEAGILFDGGENFRVRVAIGGEADFSLGGAGAEGFSVHSDMEAYAAVRADIARFLEVYLKGGWDGGYSYATDDFGGDFQLMTGVKFLF